MRPPPIPVRFVSSLSSPNSGSEDEDIRLSKGLIQNGSVVLQRLLELQNKGSEASRQLSGWQDESTERHFQKQRQIADTASPDLNKIWFERMKGLLREIDNGVRCIPMHKPLQFLDLGCCPGGFSSYILDKNPNARGLGISLPVVEGGHEFALERRHLSRFQLTYQNLTYYQLGPTLIDDQRLHNTPSRFRRQSFDLALLDGHQLRTQISSQPWDSDRLLISQLILALQTVKAGGTIIVKLPLPHKPVAARILYFLYTISRRLLRWKPESMHANRGTFYAVGKGIGEGRDGEKIPRVLLALKDLWVELTFGGEEGMGRPMDPGDLNFLVSMDELVDLHLEWLSNFGRPLWEVHEKALRNFYQRHCVN